MFSQLSELPDESNKTLPSNLNCNRMNSVKRKNKRKANKRKARNKELRLRPLKGEITMSAWAESFTNAATWQLKQQIAYWKSKATALEYENRLLHDIIRGNYENNAKNDEEDNMASDVENMAENEEEPEEPEDEGEWEVSDEFIQFMLNNRLKRENEKEKEKRKALQNSEQLLVKQMEAMPEKGNDTKQETLKKLYGDKWQKIAGIESVVQSQYLTNCDLDQPEYWPNIPLNFDYN